jgi:MYXO-CTERM domain-containing protein
MTLRRLLVVLCLLVGGSAVLPATPAWACSCARLDEAEAFDMADTVFVGVVQSIRRSDTGPLDVRFAVESVRKGAAAGEITVQTSDGGASCGYGFATGKRYRVFAHDGGTGLCSGNRPQPPRPEPVVGSSPVRAAPDRGLEPVRSDRPGAVWWSIGVLALVAVGAVVVLRRRRPR